MRRSRHKPHLQIIWVEFNWNVTFNYKCYKWHFKSSTTPWCCTVVVYIATCYTGKILHALLFLCTHHYIAVMCTDTIEYKAFCLVLHLDWLVQSQHTWCEHVLRKERKKGIQSKNSIFNCKAKYIKYWLTGVTYPSTSAVTWRSFTFLMQ